MKGTTRNNQHALEKAFGTSVGLILCAGRSCAGARDLTPLSVTSERHDVLTNANRVCAGFETLSNDPIEWLIHSHTATKGHRLTCLFTASQPGPGGPLRHGTRYPLESSADSLTQAGAQAAPYHLTDYYIFRTYAENLDRRPYKAGKSGSAANATSTTNDRDFCS